MPTTLAEKRKNIFADMLWYCETIWYWLFLEFLDLWHFGFIPNVGAMWTVNMQNIRLQYVYLNSYEITPFQRKIPVWFRAWFRVWFRPFQGKVWPETDSESAPITFWISFGFSTEFPLALGTVCKYLEEHLFFNHINHYSWNFAKKKQIGEKMKKEQRERFMT